MRIFLTGATGFIGSRLVAEFLSAGHSVIGVTRSDDGALRLATAGAAVHRATLEDAAALAAGAEQADAVVHTAFDHDFSRFAENCAKDRRVIAALGAVLRGSDRPLLVTSGTGMGTQGPGRLAVEHVVDVDHPNPRVASELEGAEQLAAGVNVSVMRLPQVHDPVAQGLVSPYIAQARERGVVGYVGDGLNRWPAAHVDDVARLYRLAIERAAPGARYHAVAEEGIAARDIAQVIGEGLGMPVRSIAAADAPAHFGWLAMFMGLDMPASSAWTRETLGWRPTGPGLLDDLRRMDYAVA